MSSLKYGVNFTVKYVDLACHNTKYVFVFCYCQNHACFRGVKSLFFQLISFLKKYVETKFKLLLSFSAQIWHFTLFYTVFVLSHPWCIKTQRMIQGQNMYVSVLDLLHFSDWTVDIFYMCLLNCLVQITSLRLFE